MLGNNFISVFYWSSEHYREIIFKCNLISPVSLHSQLDIFTHEIPSSTYAYMKQNKENNLSK